MDSDKVLFAGVGNASVNHVAYQTAFGMMIPATTLFTQLGYSVHPTRKASGDWGKAIFMVKDGSVPIQLSDSVNDWPINAGENHVGIGVDSPLTVANAIVAWAHKGGSKADYEPVGDGKYFVMLPEILTMPLELVPNSN